MLKFWSYWMGATIFGFVGGFVGVFLVVGSITGEGGPESLGIPFEVFFPIWLSIAATVMATLQWLTIRRRGRSLAGWIPATTIGVLIGIALLTGLVSVFGEPETIFATILSGALHGIVVGAVVGTAQWVALGDVDPTKRWIKANVLGLLVAAVVGDVVGFYTSGGTGTMVIFGLWQALVAPTLYRLTTEQLAGKSARPAPAHT